MIQLVDRLNTEYDVQNISSREAAEQALNRLTVSANDRAQSNTVLSLWHLSKGPFIRPSVP